MADSTQVTQELIFRMMDSNHSLVANWLVWSSAVILAFGLIGAIFQFYLNNRKVTIEVERSIANSKEKFEAELEKKVKSLKSAADKDLKNLEKKVAKIRADFIANTISTYDVQALIMKNSNNNQAAFFNIMGALYLIKSTWEDPHIQLYDDVFTNAIEIFNSITFNETNTPKENLSELLTFFKTKITSSVQTKSFTELLESKLKAF